MSEELELKLIKKIEELEREIELLKNENIKNIEKIPTYSFSKIRDIELNKIVDIEQKIDRAIFDKWFNADIKLKTDEVNLLKELLEEELDYISLYDEEDLKMRFLSPILRKVNFKSENFRDFYDEKIVYETEKFILNGEVDFTISKGLRFAKKPYFFIQEFKRAEDFSNPRPQLLAELISAVELNSENEMSGAYIVGENWHFVILQRLKKHKYQYYISKTFNSTNIEDLKAIYKNLLYVKSEIIEKAKKEL